VVAVLNLMHKGKSFVHGTPVLAGWSIHSFFQSLFILSILPIHVNYSVFILFIRYSMGAPMRCGRLHEKSRRVIHPAAVVRC
jgi:hypothetical protein